MKEILQSVYRPDIVARVVKLRIRLVLTCTVVGLFLGVGRYLYAQKNETLPLYEAEFVVSGTNWTVVKQSFTSIKFVEKAVGDLEIATVSGEKLLPDEISSWIKFPSALEGELTKFVVRLVPTKTIGSDQAKLILQKLVEWLPNEIRNNLIDIKPKRLVLAITSEFSPSSFLAPEIFLNELMSDKKFSECLGQNAKELTGRVRYSVLDSQRSLELFALRPYAPRAALHAMAEEDSEIVSASEALNKWWEVFFECFDSLSLENLNQMNSGIFIYGPIASNLSGPYFNSTNIGMIATVFFPTEEVRKELVELSGLSFSEFIQSNIFKINREFVPQESWLTIELNSPKSERGMQVAKFLLDKVYGNSKRVVIKELKPFFEKPNLKSTDLVRIEPNEVRDVTLQISKPPYQAGEIQSPFKLIPMTILYSLIGLFLGIFAALFFTKNIEK